MAEREREKVRFRGGRMRVVLPDDERDRLTTQAMVDERAKNEDEEEDGRSDDD